MTPAAVAGQIVFATVSSGEYHSCGVSAAGTVYCWGSDQYGQLGVMSDVPVLVVR
jgi:alpha-tubulin suppressor-like RCC1 family protein